MFLQINDELAINIDKIESILPGEEHSAIYMNCYQEDGFQVCYSLTGEDNEKFLRWWEEKADVYKL